MAATTGSSDSIGQDGVTAGFLGYSVYFGGTFEPMNGSTINVSAAPEDSDHGACSERMMLFRFISYVIVCLPIALLGTAGNIISFVVLCKQKQRLTTTVLLQGLSVADTAVLIMLILLYSLRYFAICADVMGGYLDVYKYVFRWMYPLGYLFRMANTWLTVLLTIDRYIAVCHPLQAQRLCTISRAYKHMVALLVVALLFTTPRFFEYTLVDEEVNSFGFEATEMTKNRYYTVTYKIIVFFLFMYLVPMVLLVVLNTKLLCALQRAQAYRATLQLNNGGHTGRGGGNTNNRSVTVIVVTVVLVCIICNTTAMVSHILYSLGLCFEHLDDLEIYRRYMSNISNILTTINSAINFIIYCLCSRNFRVVCARTFRCGRPKRHPAAGESKRSTSGCPNTGMTYFSLSRSSTRQGNVSRGRHETHRFNGYLN